MIQKCSRHHYLQANRAARCNFFTAISDLTSNLCPPPPQINSLNKQEYTAPARTFPDRGTAISEEPSLQYLNRNNLFRVQYRRVVTFAEVIMIGMFAPDPAPYSLLSLKRNYLKNGETRDNQCQKSSPETKTHNKTKRPSKQKAKLCIVDYRQRRRRRMCRFGSNLNFSCI